MIEWILILLIITYDLFYVKSFPLLALIIAFFVAPNNLFLWFYSFIISSIIYELFSFIKSKRIVEYDDYINISNSITLLPNINLSTIFMFALVYIILLYGASKIYKNKIPTAAQLYISSVIVLLYYLLLS